jgi:hypothetical protein
VVNGVSGAKRSVSIKEGFALKVLSFSPGFSRVLGLPGKKKTVSTVSYVSHGKPLKRFLNLSFAMHPAEAG